MLDKVIHKHLDKMDEMKSEIIKQVDDAVDNTDIQELMQDPEAYMLAFAEMIKTDIIDPMAERAVKLGEAVAKAIDKKDEIIIDNSDNPDINRDILDD